MFTPTAASIPPLGTSLRLKTPPNLPVNVHPLNPLDFLLRAAQIYPEKVALVHSDVEYPVSYSFSVWAQRVQNLAYALIQAGIKPGDRVAVIAPNSPVIADAHQGVIATRAILTPINTRLKPSEVEYILQHSGARLIIVDHEYTHLIQGTRIPFVVSNDSGRDGDPYETFLNNGRQFSSERGWAGLEADADENTPCLLCYTSGTTGRTPQPKGVLTTLRGSYLAAIANAFEGKFDVPLVTIRTVNYNHIWNHLLHSGVTHYCGAPTVQIGIVNDPQAQKPPRPVTAIIAGAAPTPHLIAGLETIGITPVHVYGLTYVISYAT
ncbi:hypothetical protein DXG03_007879 [Asterophora parasitica]|uniref:AMP-dependent synthetase/ligase domain-containing protein n=1 Tax=Asterophora parasitica TaxID=117018 RepID=A0A9P7G8K3_9AGAR|nr:hypothetical protein DXG03_007879 [Asterophora parasitica]